MSGHAMSTVIPCELRRDGDRLFDVSMWCLGRDVLCPEGNLLVRRGLVRHARPEGAEGQSPYTVDLPDGGRLALWGFGALCECGEAIFVPRAGFSPVLLDGVPGRLPFRAEALGPSRPPTTGHERRALRAGLASLAGWLAEHEDWVAAAVGPAWRRECFEARRKAPPVAADGLASAWRRFASRLRSLDSGFNVCTAPVAGA
ncbi:hypothetical protein [Corallococcus macrosporus]|uniref:Uncharacterized protein n=1 Tax=Myxococcus fulvus (strain ATCC BAA-855 / HW-1) TaxID=483219 RepID=F8CK10_MYXFH|nr:hypothetical protein [Corallococcus macrosporus]AEI66386.1 hypothetical protein LILAB_22455 [Corallococcus macrosporus]